MSAVNIVEIVGFAWLGIGLIFSLVAFQDEFLDLVRLLTVICVGMVLWPVFLISDWRWRRAHKHECAIAVVVSPIKEKDVV